MKYIFDSWRDANIIKKNLNNEQCELLQDILNNSKFIDKRPENFVLDYDDLYEDKLFSIETNDKYKPFKNQILTIWFVAESFIDDIDYLIEAVKDIQEEILK